MYALSESSKNIRNINLSYNYLNFDNLKDCEYSEKFVESLKNLFNTAKFINHIDFSHMNFTKPKILEILEIL